ncbi:MAG: hypothetical protein JWP00_4816 [Chloroflexi bacterium]|nr:hypothetical protein [Chloroflexota bacterium]
MYDYKFTRILVTLAAIIFGAAHLIFPQLPIDAVSIALLGIAFFPWLNPLIKSIELPGIGRLELKELKRQVEEASGAAESANQKADFAVAHATFPVQASPANSPGKPGSPAFLARNFNDLAAQYDRVDTPEPDTPVQTSEMSKLISKMISLAPYAGDFEVPANLNAPDPGKRLLAYAYLLTRPDARFLKPLVETLTQHEPSEFNQYWAILAVEKLVALDGEDRIDPEIVKELVNFLKKLPPGTDRHYELSGIVESLDQSNNDRTEIYR